MQRVAQQEMVLNAAFIARTMDQMKLSGTMTLDIDGTVSVCLLRPSDRVSLASVLMLPNVERYGPEERRSVMHSGMAYGFTVCVHGYED